MNKFKIYFLVLAVCFFCSCTEDKKVVEESAAIITGNIEVTGDTAGNSLSVRYYDYVTASTKTERIDPAADGSFEVSIGIVQPLEITLAAYNVLPLIVAPGDSLHVAFTDHIDRLEFSKSIKFTGDRIEENRTLRSYREEMDLGINQFYDLELETGYQDLKDYLLSEKPIAAHNIKFLNQDTSTIMEDYAHAEQKYFAASTLIDYVNYRNYKGYPAPQVDAPFFDFVSNIPELEQEDLVNTNTVSRLIYNLSYYYQMLAALQVDSNELFDEMQNDINAIKLVTTKKETPLLHSYVVHKMIMRSFENQQVEVYEANREQLAEYIVTADLLESLENKYQELKKRLEKPEIPDEAVILDFEASTSLEFLDKLVAAADGKVIYIDNWATWCQPCIQEFKDASKKLHADYSDEVYFVYLCHNSRPETYLPTISQYEIKGAHYFLEEEESVMMQQALNIQGFPTYTMINKNGEIVKSDYIHRPSYGPTRTILDKMINE